LADRCSVSQQLGALQTHSSSFLTQRKYSCSNFVAISSMQIPVASGTLYILHCNPRHVSSNIMLICRRSNCIVTASGIVTLRKELFSAPVESGLSALSTGAQNSSLRRVTIPDAVTIQFDLLKMSMVLPRDMSRIIM